MRKSRGKRIKSSSPRALASAAVNVAQAIYEKRMESSPEVTKCALVVLGMHHSGTSTMARALKLLGCDKPERPTAEKGNEALEADPIQSLHSKLLASAASSWDDWTPIAMDWRNSVNAEEFQENAEALIRENFAKSPLFVLKSPEICRLVPFWSKALDNADVPSRFILTHRNPLEVSQSLKTHDGIESEVALLIWLRHVLEAEAETRGKLRCFTSHSELMTNWRALGEKIQNTLKVYLPPLSPQIASELETLLNDELRLQTVAAEKVRPDTPAGKWAENTFAILERWVVEGESEKDYNALDEIHQQFDQSIKAYAIPLRQLLNQKAEWKKLGQESARLAFEKERLEKQVEALKYESATILAEADQKLRQQALSHEHSLRAAQEAAKAEMALKLEALRGALEERRLVTEQREAALEEIRSRLMARDQEHASEIGSLKRRLQDSFSTLEEVQAVKQQEEEAIRASFAMMNEALQAEMLARESEFSEVRRDLEQRLQDSAAALEEARVVSEQEEEARHEFAAVKEALEAEIWARDGDLSQLRSTLEQRRHELDHSSEVIAALQANIASMKIDQTHAGEREIMLRENLEVQKAQTRKINQSLIDRNIELSELTRLINDRDIERNVLEKKLVELRAALEKNTQELNQSRDTITSLKSSLSSFKSAAIHADEREIMLRGQMDNQDTHIQRLKYSLGERDRELSDLIRLISERDVARDNLEKELVKMHSILKEQKKNESGREESMRLQLIERETSLRQAEQSLSAYHHEFSQMAQIIVTKESERATETRKTEQLWRELERTREAMAELQQAHDEKSTYIEELFASSSWKVTKPLRRSAIVMRRLMRRA